MQRNPEINKGRIRGRRSTLRLIASFAVATVVTTGIAPGSSWGDSAADPIATPTRSQLVGLSMAVKAGEPVPLEIVTEHSRSEFSRRKATGKGIDVALIDSGVSPVAGLDQSGKVLYGPDLSNEGGFPNLANFDTFGHGTHLAGIIAGDDGGAVGGIATGSRIVSVKVAGATGETNVAQVIAGIDWVIAHKNDPGINIRVLNLSLGVAGIASSAGDPLSAAVERAWLAGIVVVVAAGNRGNAAPLDSPAISPYVIAVGAIESYDSSGAQDWMAPWSSGGDGTRHPDVVAPGRSIVSFRVPGSMLDQLHPEAVVGDTYFRGSGTSQSAAVVSGFVAALLSRQPALTPDQVKFLFTSRAVDVVGNSSIDGAGKIDAKQTARHLKDARSAPTQNFALAIPATGVAGLIPPSGASWSGGSWNGASWSGGTWSGASWSGASWSGASWSTGIWSGASWSGASWSGASWSGATWSGASWSGASWSGASWCGASWLGQVWE
ncbi:MAG: S8 family serine peptidase [Actinobacteria bacterium]|nr:S8 family serine peptidase [Actinomycetota bacterium]